MTKHTQDAQALIERLYAAFNRRDIDATLAFMSEDVDWPKASEGGRVVGKEGIRAYWNRQWSEFDPQVDPLEVTEQGTGQVIVKVHQRVTALSGELLFDGTIWHAYTLAGGFITRMDIHETVPEC